MTAIQQLALAETQVQFSPHRPGELADGMAWVDPHLSRASLVRAGAVKGRNLV